MTSHAKNVDISTEDPVHCHVHAHLGTSTHKSMYERKKKQKVKSLMPTLMSKCGAHFESQEGYFLSQSHFKTPSVCGSLAAFINCIGKTPWI